MSADGAASAQPSPSSAPGDLEERFRSTDPRIVSPLAEFAGANPPAPAWFQHAIEARPERTVTQVQGAGIETLAWGERGRPGLLFLHGNGAHADWWSFIAPFFAAEFRVAAISWSGMGRSDWRDAYSIDQCAEEAFAGAEAAGLFEAQVKPVFIAHSFGGASAMRAAAASGDRLRGAILVDSAVRPPTHQWRGPPQRNAPTRVYPTLTEALARFRLMPPQPCENAFIVDYIAREALRPAPLPDGQGPDGGGKGWTWRFDPFLWSKMDFSRPMESASELQGATCPLAFVWGDRSRLMESDSLAYTRENAAPGTPFVAIPDSEHHVLLDQPLALVAAIRALLESWAR